MQALAIFPPSSRWRAKNAFEVLLWNPKRFEGFAMRKTNALLLWIALAAVAAAQSFAAAPPAAPAKVLAPLLPAADQLALLQSSDPKLARNKKHVFDFWRIVYEGGQMDRVAEFMAPEYVQHNPNVESGRDAFVRTIGSTRKPRSVASQILVPVIAITAERDIVTVMWARKVRDRERPDETYFMTWFDVFRIDGKSGLIAEHWDSSERWGTAGRPPGAEFFP
jgi:predicted SnoaL-like aldol condensation-catalyzing enzyme